MHIMYSHQRGFTLIEAIITLIIIAIISGLLGFILLVPLETYRDTQKQTDVTEQLRRVSRNFNQAIQHALPHSVRIKKTGNITALEFLHVLDMGFFRQHTENTHSALDFTVNQGQFSIIGKLQQVNKFQFGNGATTCLQSQADCLIIQNTGQPPTSSLAITTGQSHNAYLGMQDNYAGNIATLSNGNNQQLQFDNSDVNNWHFSATGHNRFYIVDMPSSFICDTTTGELKHYRNYSITATQTTTLPADQGYVVIDNLTNCDFNYTAPNNGRTGFVTMTFTLSPNIHFFQQAAIHDE